MTSIILGSTVRALSRSAPAQVRTIAKPVTSPENKCRPAKIEYASQGLTHFFGATKRFCGRAEIFTVGGGGNEDAINRAKKLAESRARLYFSRQCQQLYKAAAADGSPGTAHTFWGDYSLELQCPQSECKLSAQPPVCRLKKGKRWDHEHRGLQLGDELSVIEKEPNTWEEPTQGVENGHFYKEICAHYTGLLCECEQECIPTSPKPVPYRNRR